MKQPEEFKQLQKVWQLSLLTPEENVNGAFFVNFCWWDLIKDERGDSYTLNILLIYSNKFGNS